MAKNYPLLNDKEWLFHKYWIEELSTYDIAKLLGCNAKSVWVALRRMGIKTRRRGEFTKKGREKLSKARRGKKPTLGMRHTKEQKQKISEALTGRKVSEETRKKMAKAQEGKCLSEEHKQKLSEAHKGQISWMKGKHHSEETKEKISKAKKNPSEETRAKLRDARKHQKIPTHHTKPELIYEEICKKDHLPFRYTGDGSFWIGNINPDFVETNGKKIVVEIFGDYWHSPLLNWKLKEKGTLAYRKRILKEYGWKLIVFWETDLKREDAELFVLRELKKHKIYKQ